MLMELSMERLLKNLEVVVAAKLKRSKEALLQQAALVEVVLVARLGAVDYHLPDQG